MEREERLPRRAQLSHLRHISRIGPVDFSKYLPLSQRRSDDDESAVTSDRRAEIASTVDRARELLSEMDAERPDAARRFVAEAGLAAAGAASTDPLDLSAIADEVRTGRKRKVSELARAVRAVLELADECGESAGLPSLTLGAVALYASGTAPFDRRAVISGHTVKAIDADWQFGSGPELRGTAEGIARFLLALSDTPPRAPRA
ncbi:hypothetical protein AAIB33_13385 [Microbacterium sp. AZCO]|uniref:hypothetical protein n=1 Tax=Microbacterium sp. AZCO TaxID=3142976 RepID=UPI0031F34A32